MAPTDKIQEFEYVLHKLINWYCDSKGFDADTNTRKEQFNADNDFSLIKIIKLLFFVSTAEGENSHLLNKHFTNYFALPYGPVEGEIYDYIKQRGHNVANIKIQRDNAQLLSGINMQNNKPNLDSAIEKLKQDAPSIILNAPFELVDISHKRLSWQSAFSEAEIHGKASHPMSINLMKRERKYYA